MIHVGHILRVEMKPLEGMEPQEETTLRVGTMPRMEMVLLAVTVPGTILRVGMVQMA